MEEPRWLTDTEQHAWRGYRRMRALLDLRVTRDLARSGLSDADYDVLTALSETDGHQLRLSELAGQMLWTTSRLSHHISRMQQRGLVSRKDSPADGRGSDIVLTAKGVATIEEAAPNHVEAVRTHFIDLLSPDQLRTLADISETVIGHLAEEHRA